MFGMNDVLDPEVKALFVVAHPDDETVWFGGLMIECNWAFDVLCCSIPRSDPIRAYDFHDACHVLGAREARVIPAVEPVSKDDRLDPMVLDILSEKLLHKYDFVITHNSYGEYGHKHHVSVNRIVSGRARPETLVVTGYGHPRSPNLIIDVDWTRKSDALRSYRHSSPHHKQLPKWEALLERYGSQFDLTAEPYYHVR